MHTDSCILWHLCSDTAAAETKGNLVRKKNTFVFVLLREYGQREQIHRRNTEAVGPSGSVPRQLVWERHPVSSCLSSPPLWHSGQGRYASQSRLTKCSNISYGSLIVCSFSSISASDIDFCSYCMYIEEGKHYMNLNGDINAIQSKIVCLKYHKNHMRLQPHTVESRMYKQKEMSWISGYSVLNQEAFIVVKLS